MITLWRNQRGTTHIFAARCGKRRFPALAGRCAPDAADHPNHFGSGRPGNHLSGCLPGADRTEQGRPGSALLRQAPLPERVGRRRCRQPAAAALGVLERLECPHPGCSGLPGRGLPVRRSERPPAHGGQSPAERCGASHPDRHPGRAEQCAPERPCSERSRPLAVAGGIPGGSGRCHQNRDRGG